MEKIKDAKTLVHGQEVLTLCGNQPVGSHALLETHKTRIKSDQLTLYMELC